MPWDGMAEAAAPILNVRALPRLPFDHSEIAAAALARLRSKAAYLELPLHLMPPYFTLAELQDGYERVMDEEIGRTLFRKRMVDSGLIVKTVDASTGGAHRPVALYRIWPAGLIPQISVWTTRNNKS